MSSTKHNTVLVLFCLIGVCHGRRLQTMAARERHALVVESQSPLKAVAMLLLQFNQAAALHPCSQGVSRPVLVDAHIGSLVSNRQGQVQMMMQDDRKLYVEQVQKRDKAVTMRFLTGRTLQSVLDGKNIFILGVGSERLPIFENFAEHYLDRPVHEVSKVMRIAYPKLDPDFECTLMHNCCSYNELIEGADIDELEELGSEILARIQAKHASNRVIVGWDGTGSDADFEVMKDSVVANIDISPRKCGVVPKIWQGEETLARWQERHKKAPLDVNLELDIEDYGGWALAEDITAKQLAEAILEHVKPGMMDSVRLSWDCGYRRNSELRKDAENLDIDEDAIEEAFDLEDDMDARQAITDLILQAKGLQLLPKFEENVI